MELLIIAAVLGCIPGAIAMSKGRSFFGFWFYGFLLFPVALIHSLVMRRDGKALEERQLQAGDSKKCPQCAEIIKAEAQVCRFCGADVSGIRPARVSPLYKGR